MQQSGEKKAVAARQLPDLFRDFLRQQDDEESIFSLGFSKPKGPAQFVEWHQVEAFLQMTEAALRVRVQAAEQLEQRLSAAQERLEKAVQEKSEVSRLEASAAEDSSFLAGEVQGLMAEKAALKAAVQKLERDKQYLLEENRLLRRQVEAEGGEDGGEAVRVAEELRSEQQRCLVLENEAMQLRARVAALERANQAQHVALLSCIEESERVRLQQEHSECLRLQQLHICGSPSAHTDWALQLSCKSTDDSSCGGEYGDAQSHGSCATPVGRGSSVDEAGPQRRQQQSQHQHHHQQQYYKLDPGSPLVLRPAPKALAAQQQQRQQPSLAEGGFEHAAAQGEAAHLELSPPPASVSSN